MKHNIILKSLALIACLLCSLRTAAYVDSYACYTPENTTLTFYYDDQHSSRPGNIYNLNVGIQQPEWYTDGIFSEVTKVVFDSSFAGARSARARPMMPTTRVRSTPTSGHKIYKEQTPRFTTWCLLRMNSINIYFQLCCKGTLTNWNRQILNAKNCYF